MYRVKKKSQLVAKGFSQVAGVDFNETTSPTPASDSVKMIAHIANEKRLPVYNLDISQAFMQTPLNENFLYISPLAMVNFQGKFCDFSNVSTD